MAIKTNYVSSSSADDFVTEHALDFSSLGFPQPSRVYASPSYSASGDSGSNFLDISGFDLSGARFVRLGEDLLIVSGEGSVLIASYFSGVRSSIWSAEFGFYSAELVASFLETSAMNGSGNGSGNNGAVEKKYALGLLRDLFTNDGGGVSSIGVVESAEGDVQVTRDGMVITLVIGDAIFLNDIISTGDDSEIFLRFTDKMEFRLGSDGRLAIDEFIYDEMSSDGTQILSILSGAFSYASGLIAGKDPTSVELKTPYGTLGIRGTKILGKVEPIDSSDAGGNGDNKGGKGGLSVTILEGRVALLQDGAEVADISGRFETLIVRGSSAGDYSYDISTLSVAEIVSGYDFLEGSVEQLEEIIGSAISLGISEGDASGGDAIDGDFSVASESEAEAVELSFIESSSATLAESAAEAATDDEEDSSDEVSTVADITGNDDIVEPIGASFNDIRGGEGHDVLTGTAGADRIYGEGGRDELLTLGGNDELYGGADNDILVGGRGDDLLVGGAGADEHHIMVGDGSDIIREVIDATINEVQFRSSASGDYEADDFSRGVFTRGGNDLRISLNIGGIRQEVTLKDYYLGTGVFRLSFFDSTTESVPSYIEVPNFIFGTAGGDTLTGTAGVDIIYGFAGKDVLIGEGGGDILDGGAGEDTVSYANAGAAVTASLADTSNNFGDAAGDSYKSIENIRGATNHHNDLDGDGGNNKLYGGAVNDQLYGLAGNDELYGGADQDELHGGAGNDIIVGGAGKDTLDGGAGNDELQGGVGLDNYYFEVGDGNDRITDADGGYLYFRSLVNKLYAASDFSPSSFSRNGQNLRIDVTVGGVAQSVTIVNYYDNPGLFTLSYKAIISGAYTAVAIPNFIDGTSGGETLTGTAGVDIIRGLGGDDVLDGGADGDVLDGGAGEDTAYYANASAVTASLADASVNTGDAAGDSYVSIENLRGSLFYSNTLTGDTGNNVLTGGSVVDKLYGGAGDDVLEGADGVDEYYFYVGDGNDRITDVPVGGAVGSSHLYFNSGDSGNYGASDFSTSIFSRAVDNLVISLLVGGVAQSVTLVDYFDAPHTFTLNYNEVANGAYKTVSIPYINLGTSGNDNHLTGSHGFDIIRGFAGDDVLEGGADGDILDGGAGEDTASYANAGGQITANLADPSVNTDDAAGDSYTSIENLRGAHSYKNFLHGDGGSNTLTGGASIDYLHGGTGNDELSGGVGNDYLYGEAGNDIIEGGSGNDELYGQVGNDELIGGADNDRLVGGRGDDVMKGGDGVDEYYFHIGNGNDRITDADGGELYFSSGDSGNFAASNFAPSIFTKSGQDLVISLLVGGVSQKVTIVDYFSNSGTFTLRYNTVQGGAYTTLSVPENFIIGTAIGETLNGTADADLIRGLGGNDVLQGGVGNDILDGGSGVDELYGGDGDDTLIYRTGDILDGGAGEDTASFAHYTTFASARLSDSAFTLIENIRGSMNYGNNLAGDDNNNKLYGGDMDDRLQGGAGSDLLDGGAGKDTADYLSALAGITANLADASLNTGEAAGDSYVSIENLHGSSFYSNTLTGDTGNNVLTGGSVVDKLYGGAGDDLLNGGDGDDLLYGGDGMDTYQFARYDRSDTITDTDGGKLLFVRSTSGGYDSASFVAGAFAKSGDDLVISPHGGGGAGVITIVDYYDDPSRFSIYYTSGDTENLVATDVIPT